MTAIVFPLSTAPGTRPHESGGRLINCYAEPLQDGRAVRRRAPGYKIWGTTEYGTPRGLFFDGTTLFGAWEGKLVKWTAAGAGTDVDDLDGTDPVYFARNNKTPTPDMVLVTGSDAFTFTGSAVTSYPDGDVGSPNSVESQSGYFFFTYGDGSLRNTALNSTGMTSLDLAKAESRPDTLYRPIPFAGQMYFCGSFSTEVWANTGNATGFPYSFSHTIQKGLLAPRAIAGYENGFSTQLIFVGDDNTVGRLNGYQWEKISPPDLDRLIEALSDKTELHAKVYKSAGHSFWELSCDAWTWTFDLNTEKWHERRSYLKARSRAVYTVYAFGKWLTQDTESGNILEITANWRKDVTDPLVYRAESQLVPSDAQFPGRQVISRADFDVVTGVGVIGGEQPIESDPVGFISWSDDGGYNWSTPLQRPLGQEGRPDIPHPYVLNTGMAGPKGRRWRFEASDPVDVSLIGGQQFGEART